MGEREAVAKPTFFTSGAQRKGLCADHTIGRVGLGNFAYLDYQKARVHVELNRVAAYYIHVA